MGLERLTQKFPGLKNIKEAAELYLEDLKENKERIPSGQEQVVVSPVEVRA